MLKLVFVDMDGTFLDSNKAVCPRNKDVLDLAARLGVQFVPCTGRNVNGIPAEMVDHAAVRYAVCCNGALIRDVRTGEILHEVDLDKDTVRGLFNELKDLPITFDLFADGKIYTLDDRWDYIDQMGCDEPTRRQLKSFRVRYDGTFEQLMGECGDICRINIFFLDEASKQRAWDVVDADPMLRRSTSLPSNIEITHREAHKGAALAWLCGHLGVDVADAVAFGDGDNDLSMIRAAGDGVAMANAIPEVLAAADHVTTSCDEAGVAAYLEPILSAMD